RKNASNKNLQGEILEDSLALIPQLLSAKAQKLPPGDPGRKANLESAVKEFDTFNQKFPQSPEVEQANLEKARALYFLERFEEATQPLRTNLQKFPLSESLLDNQYMLALILNTQANETIRKATVPGEEKSALAAYDEAEKLLRDIVGKRTDLAMMNDAQFQLGEMLSARGAFSEPDKRDAIFYKALDAYRNTYPNDAVIQAQNFRIKNLQERALDAGRRRDLAGLRHYQAMIPREQGKLADITARPDQTLAAKIKAAQIYLELHKDKERERMDEARVLYRFVEKFTKDPEQLKNIHYGLTLTYAGQHIPKPAEEQFAKWIAAYKDDPMGENLPLLMGSMYLDADPAVNDPKKAIEYFEKQAAMFPKSKFTGQAMMQAALALIQLKEFDAATKRLTEFLAANPPKEQAVAAEFGLATVYKDTGATDQAIETFQIVSNKYPGTEQAEQAAFWTGQMRFGKGDPKAAIGDLKAFIAKFPNSELVPTAMLTLGTALRDSGQTDVAMKTWQELAEKFPKSEAAPATFFLRATGLQGAQKYDEMKAVMKDFVAKYPESDRVFSAYDYVAQVQSIQEKKPEEAIKTYEEYVAKYPAAKDAPAALVKVSDQWKKVAETMGRFVAIPAAQKDDWRKFYDKSVETAEKVIEKYPESAEVAAALQNLLKAQEQFVLARLKADSNVENYFNELAKKYGDKPGLANKVKFTLAGYFAEKDEGKALKMMTEAFDPKLIYAWPDLETYAETLIEQKKYDEADKIVTKMETDFALPKNADISKQSRSALEPVASALFIKAKVLQNRGKNEEAAALFARLKQEYPWSPKQLEADLGIGIDLFQKKKYEDATKTLGPVARATAGPVEIRAKAMMTLGEISEAEGDIDTAINNYIKIATFFEGVPEFAADGLWRGAQLQEKKASGELKQIQKATPVPEKKSEAVKKDAK
ncbi:MAG: outer membrane protein assembly factor BamD, partial [Chthoniobacteraceae bacterium]